MSYETWKDIPGYEGLYQVSDAGRVRSVGRTIRAVSRHGTQHTRTYKGRVLKPGRLPSGHLSVVLGHGAPGVTIHSLVMLAFVGPCPEGMEVCHRDRNPTNNCLSNLRYDTRAENLRDEYAADCGAMAKLTCQQVHEIKDKLAQGPRGIGRKLAVEYGVTESAISDIKHGRSWKWVE